MGRTWCRSIVISGSPTATVVKHFFALEDPRADRAKLHQLIDIIVIASCGVI